MDKHQVRACLDATFAAGNKEAFMRLADARFLASVVEAAWDMRGELAGLAKDAAAFQQLTERIEAARKQPGVRGRCLEAFPAERRALVRFGGVREEVTVAPHIEMGSLRPGTEVLLQGNQTGGRTIADLREDTGFDGCLATVAEMLDGYRAAIEENGAKVIAQVAEGLDCAAGSTVRYDPVAHLVLEVLERGEVAALRLERPPRHTFDDIGGLAAQKLLLRERLIYPVVHREAFSRYGLDIAKGALLHGPPGNGKTMLAGAIFNEMRALRGGDATEGFFVINGPECLSEWAGKTERTIREVFQRAREAANRSGLPSVVFWDELESLAGIRRDSPTYMPEKTVVPTLLAELQGLEEHGGVVFLAATNRPDLVDPALLRPGRLGDVLVEVPRPGREAGAEILARRFRGELPSPLAALVDHGLVERIVAHVYDTGTPLASPFGGVLRRDMASGALLAHVAKELILSACLSEICGKRGSMMDDSLAVVDRLMAAQIMAQTRDSGGALPSRPLQTGGYPG